MEKLIFFLGCFVVFAFLAEAGTIPPKKNGLGTSSEEESLEDNSLESKENEENENSLQELKNDVGPVILTKKETKFLIPMWEKNVHGMVVVPYTFDPIAGFGMSRVSCAESEKEFLVNELKNVERRTCIRFKPRKDEIDYIEIFDSPFCNSPIGKSGGKQKISMGRANCFHKGFMTHEMMHALGFHHMQQAYDRDDYVTINFENLKSNATSDFKKVSESFFNYFGTSYDFDSVMHYPKDLFSKNGKDTIVPHDLKFSEVIGRSGEMSEGDVIRINKMYGCKYF